MHQLLVSWPLSLCTLVLFYHFPSFFSTVVFKVRLALLVGLAVRCLSPVDLFTKADVLSLCLLVFSFFFLLFFWAAKARDNLRFMLSVSHLCIDRDAFSSFSLSLFFFLLLLSEEAPKKAVF